MARWPWDMARERVVRRCKMGGGRSWDCWRKVLSLIYPLIGFAHKGKVACSSHRAVTCSRHRNGVREKRGSNSYAAGTQSTVMRMTNAGVGQAERITGAEARGEG